MLKEDKKFFFMLGIVCLFAICILYLKDIFALFGVIYSILRPVFLGVLFAFLFKTPMLFIENRTLGKFSKKHRKGGRLIALAFSYIIVFALAFLFIYFIVPQLANSAVKIFESLTQFISQSINMLNELIVKLNMPMISVDVVQNSLMSSFESVFSQFLKNTPDILVVGKSAISFFSSVFFAVAFSGYILYDKEGMKKLFKGVLNRCLSLGVANKVIRFIENFIIQFDNFFRGQMIEAGILGFMCFVGMLVLNIPYAPLVSVIVGVTAIIPLLGAIIGTIPSVLIIMTVSPIKAIIFVVFIVLLQMVEGNLIYPHVVGTRVELPPFFVLLAIVVGGGVLGVVGILLCVPLTSVIYAQLNGD